MAGLVKVAHHCSFNLSEPRRLLVYLLLVCLAILLPLHAVCAQHGKENYSNRLVNSDNPYLLLHAHNPVDWYPWGPEALEKARRENKPVFVSIGYSSCFWCHVAEREIYSNPQIAKLMNEWFVNIKVDREERPDIDRIYIAATRAMNGRGGWPNNVFLTPDLKPFFGGSYFPPDADGGRESFPQILTRLHQAWINEQEKVIAEAESVYRMLQQAEQVAISVDTAPRVIEKWLDQAIRESAASFDKIEGGFGGGYRKFPRSPQLSMLLASSTRVPQVDVLEMVSSTLEAMAEGGVMDQLAGGFHRYSIEPDWSIPHFEKMLYDNAQLLGVYAQAYALTRRPLFRQVALRTALYLTREMQAPGGGFYSALDAEVEGVEGASYVWSRGQIESVLGEAGARRFFALYELTPVPEAHAGHQQPSGGVLRLKPVEARQLVRNHRLAAEIDNLASLKERLLEVRLARMQPVRDEKIVIADNALAIIAFAQAGQALQDTALIETALRTANWLWKHAFEPETGELKHQFFRGNAGGPGFLDDYALLGKALMTLYYTSDESLWQARARQVTDAMLQNFTQPDGALSMSRDMTDLLVAPPIQGDSAKPSAQSAAIGLLLELAVNTQQAGYAVAARKAFTPLLYARVNAHPSEWGTLLVSLSDASLRMALHNATKSHALANAETGLNSANYVDARGYWQPAKQGIDVVVKINIDAGYHINANPASDPYLVATELLIDGHPDVAVEYPGSQLLKAAFAPQGLAVYEGRILLRVHLPPEFHPPSLSLRVQACNDELCLAPATIAVPVSSSKEP